MDENHKLSIEEQVERDALAFAELLYDIFREKKQKEKQHETTSLDY